MIYPFFILWGPWFWFLLVVDFIILVWAVENESPGNCFLTLFMLFLLLWILGDFNVLEWIKENPKTFFIRLGLYIPIGIVYSVIKYILKLTDRRRKVTKIISKFLDENKVKSEKDLTTAQKGSLLEELRYSKHPTFSQSTGKVIFWMSYWPWSAFWTMLNNPLKWLWEEVYEKMVTSLRRIYNNILGKQNSQIEEWEQEYENDRGNVKQEKINY